MLLECHISTQTVCNCLRQSGLLPRRACIRIPLTRLHKEARLNWAQDQINWTDNDWDPVLFTDESRYCIDITYRRIPLWRRSGERFQDANISERDRYGGGSIMVWASISRGGRTDLHIVIRGMITGVRYKDEILDVCQTVRWCNRTPVRPHGRQRSTSSCQVTAMVEAPSWCGLVSAEVDEQTCTS